MVRRIDCSPRGLVRYPTTNTDMGNIDQISEAFNRDGFFFPLSAMPSAQTAEYRRVFRSLEDRIETSGIGRGGQLNQMHSVLCFVNEIARNDRILDAVEAVIGPDIMVWGSTFFIKEPRTTGFVSWHQDLHYWGLEDRNAMVSAWLALGPVSRSNGCMQFVRSSHRHGLVEHKDEFDADNFLYRGQVALAEIDESDIVHVELEAGQFSLHHGYLLHSSPANLSNIRRWGLTINYIAPHNRQVVAPRDFAMLVRGEDRFGHFAHVPAPESDLCPEALQWHRRLLEAKDLATYAGVAHP